MATMFQQFRAAVSEEIQMIFVARLIHLYVSDGGQLKGKKDVLG